jgi:hypothetical protein
MVDVRLSWNEIRTRAAAFAQEWAGQGYEKGQTQLFYRDFFEVFGVPVRRVATFEEPVKNLGDRRGFIDLFWKGVLLVEQKSVGRDLVKAKKQALDYFPGLKDTDLPRFVLLSDFQTFELYDLDEDESVAFPLADLPRQVEKFGFIIGVQTRTFTDQAPVNIKASELMGRLHDALEESRYDGHNLEQFLVRLVFCLFADDTGIFPERGMFEDLIRTRTREDGADLGPILAKLFEVLDTEEGRRSSALDEGLKPFPYINGQLFREPLRIPDFTSAMRERLLEACAFNWADISPAIFGSLFQSVMNKEERRELGAHYTTEKNILKVIGPLFLDDLWTEFRRLAARKDSRRRVELEAFQDRLAALTFFDPACGCGNFLVIAYRELRRVELAVIKEIRGHKADDRTGELDAAALSKVNVDQFYGIEIGEFPARIAETAMWMMDHLLNNELSLAFGQTYARIPLRKAPHILNKDALEADWAAFLPPDQCSYLFGNPPFRGAKYQTEKQRAQVRAIANLGKSGGTLDFVAAWFILAARYAKGRPVRVGFVSTNSITAGEQVAQLWPTVMDQNGLAISFAHRTFQWGSDARGKAQVHTVIIGLDAADRAPKIRRLFSYASLTGDPTESAHTVISPYLFDAGALANPHITVKETSRPLNGFPAIAIGTKPIDGGYLIFSEAEKAAFLADEPGAADLFRPFIGSREFLNGGVRHILHLSKTPPETIRALPKVREQLALVKDYRLGNIPPRKKLDSEVKDTGTTAKALANTPTAFHIEVVPTTPFLVVPEVSSERREYIPIAWMEPPVIPSNKLRIVPNATKPLFALLTSALHMSWVRHIGGRLKSDFQYGIGVVYNTFPPPPAGAKLDRLIPLAEAVLAARAATPNSTLADLYDNIAMSPALRKAHKALDAAVDRIYAGKVFSTDRERAEFLLGLYEKTVEPLLAQPAPKRRRKAS